MKIDKVEELTSKYEEAVVKHYHWLHSHPELSGQEKETAAYIAAQLRKIGLEPKENVGGYGVTAVIQGRRPGKCIGLRGDMDALPITERSGLPFASEKPGLMHACGHDAHVAMLLGAAMVLNDMTDAFDGCVKLIFQPSEEDSADSGAKRMIAEGALEEPCVDAMVGQHVNPLENTGNIATRAGVASAASDRFFITIDGKKSHACRPHMGVDAIAVGAYVVSALQTIVSRNINPMDHSVVTIGKFNGGDRYNVLASRVEIEGTCRNQNLAARDMVEHRMEEIVKGITEGMGAGYTFRYIRGYDPVVNAPEMVELLRETAVEIVGQENVNIPNEANMGGEDFSFFAQKVPAVYYRTGCHKAGEPVCSTHNDNMVVDTACFPVGIRVMVATALKYLEQNAGNER